MKKKQLLNIFYRNIPNKNLKQFEIFIVRDKGKLNSWGWITAWQIHFQPISKRFSVENTYINQIRTKISTEHFTITMAFRLIRKIVSYLFVKPVRIILFISKSNQATYFGFEIERSKLFSEKIWCIKYTVLWCCVSSRKKKYIVPFIWSRRIFDWVQLRNFKFSSILYNLCESWSEGCLSIIL